MPRHISGSPGDPRRSPAPGHRPGPYPEPGPYSEPGSHSEQSPYPEQSPYSEHGPHPEWPAPHPGWPAPGPYGVAPPRPWTVAAPPGTRYDHLARTPLHRWWRTAVATLVVAGGYVLASVIVFVVAGVIAALAGVPLLGADFGFTDPVLVLALTLGSIALAIPIVYGAALLIQRRPPGTLSSVTGRLRWRWLLICVPVAFGAGLVGHVILALVLVVTGDGSGEVFGWVGWGRFWPGLLVTVLLVPFQAAAEEYVFRGWVLQAFGAFVRTPWPGIVLGAVGFTALHGYTDWGIADVFAFGVLTGWLAVRTGGLEAPIALHVVNNVLGLGISAASGSIDDALRQGSVPWESLIGTAVQLVSFTIVVLALARRREIANMSPERGAVPATPVNT